MSRKPALVAGQGLAQRVEQLRDRLLALREVALGGRADLVELGVGQGEELLVVLRQRLRRQLREGAGEEIALLLRPARRLDLRRAEQLELGDGDGAGRLGGGGRLRRGLQLRRQLRRPCLRIGEASLGQAGGAGGAGQPRHVPGNADGETGDEPDEHSEDHGANVTTGCVNNGDHLTPCLGCLHGPPGGGRHPRTEPVA